MIEDDKIKEIFDLLKNKWEELDSISSEKNSITERGQIYQTVGRVIEDIRKAGYVDIDEIEEILWIKINNFSVKYYRQEVPYYTKDFYSIMIHKYLQERYPDEYEIIE